MDVLQKLIMNKPEKINNADKKGFNLTLFSQKTSSKKSALREKTVWKNAVTVSLATPWTLLFHQ
jgi:hypothetical protein